MTHLRWLWLLVPALGIAELGAHIHTRDAAPAPAEWRRLDKAVRALHQDGDLVLTAPHWAEPNLRAVFGDDLMPLRDVARPDDSSYQRAIEVSILGVQSELQAGGHGHSFHQWSKGETAQGKPWTLLKEQQEGPFTLRVWQNPRPESVSFDFVDALSEENTQVSSGRHKAPRPCTWNPKAKVSNGALHGHPTFPRQRFTCGGSDWNFVGVTVIEDQYYRPRRCIWAHPGVGALNIAFKQVTLGKSIKGFGGIPWFIERESKGTPVRLTLQIDGEEVGTWDHEDGEGWKPFVFDTQAQSQSPHDVEFSISSKRPHQREFCFQADVR